MKVKATKATKPAKDTKPIREIKINKAVKACLVAVLIAATCGCVYKGAKVVEGTDLSVGINVPSTDGALQLQLLNYLSGFRLGVAENAQLDMTYKVDETNSFLGCITTTTAKSIAAQVKPCVDEDYPSETCKCAK